MSKSSFEGAVTHVLVPVSISSGTEHENLLKSVDYKSSVTYFVSQDNAGNRFSRD